MQNSKSNNRIVEAFWDYSQSYKKEGAKENELFYSLLYVLYGYHKQYSVGDEKTMFKMLNDDRLLCELHSRAFASLTLFERLYSIISIVEWNNYEEIYTSLIIELYEKYATINDKSLGEFVTPSEVNELIAYLVKRECCDSVYDPFCGSASILPYLTQDGQNYRFVGQELNLQTSILARVMVDACGGNNNNIVCGDSLKEWSREKFEAVVTCPPMGLKFKGNIYECLESFLVNQAFKQNDARLFIVTAPVSICRTSKYDAIMENLIADRNLLDMVILMPSNLLFRTSAPFVLLVFKKNRGEDDPVRMLRLGDFYLTDEKHNCTFDINRFLDLNIDSDNEYCTLVSDKLYDYDFCIHPNMYKQQSSKLKPGQRIVTLEKLVSRCIPSPATGSGEYRITKKQLYNRYMEALLHTNSYSEEVDSRYPRKYYECTLRGKYLLISHEGVFKDLRYALHSAEQSFCYQDNISLYKINEEEVIPEYLLYILMHNDIINSTAMSFGTYLQLQIVIDDKDTQRSMIERIKQQYVEKEIQERQADSLRLGIQRNISDLEHMLGVPQSNVKVLISRLEKISPNAENYLATVRSLRDNVDYINRLIRFANAPVGEYFNLKRGNISSFVYDYVNGWKNYGGNYFELSVEDNLGDDAAVSFDKSMLTLMLDAILSNAVRHGFKKNKNYTEQNRVEINLSAVEYEEQPYVLMKVSNNGDPMADSFTLEDYISRGRFTSNTGRSGLGGYHVYQIAKGHKGYLYLDRNKSWNMIVEILLPLETTEINNEFNEYDHGETCV
jgi:signal transduction histidine kinase